MHFSFLRLGLVPSPRVGRWIEVVVLLLCPRAGSVSGIAIYMPYIYMYIYARIVMGMDVVGLGMGMEVVGLSIGMGAGRVGDGDGRCSGW